MDDGQGCSGVYGCTLGSTLAVDAVEGLVETEQTNEYGGVGLCSSRDK